MELKRKDGEISGKVKVELLPLVFGHVINSACFVIYLMSFFVGFCEVEATDN